MKIDLKDLIKNKFIYILLIIIGITIVINFIIYFIINGFDIKKKVNNNYISYLVDKDSDINFIDNKYIIESNRSDNYYKLVKIMDMKTNTLLEDDILFNMYEVGVDGYLYLYKFNIDDKDFKLYRFKDNKLETVYDFTTESEDFGEICYYEKDKHYLIGFYENDKDYNQKIYLLDKKNYSLDKYSLYGTGPRFGTSVPYLTFDKDNIIVRKVNSPGSFSFNLYNIYDNKLVLDKWYEELVYENGYYAATKDGKKGIIDVSNNVLVDFMYEEIYSDKDVFLLVKDGKVKILNNNFDLITKDTFDFPRYDELALKPNDFYVIKNTFSEYILKTGSGSLNKWGLFDKYKVYKINYDGTYSLLPYSDLNFNNGLIYSFDVDSSTYTLLDSNYNKLYDIKMPKSEDGYTISLINNNTVKIRNRSYEYYYDYKTGNNINNINNYIDGNINIYYDESLKEYIYKVNDDIVLSNSYFIKPIIIDDNSMYLYKFDNNEKKYVYIKK